MKDVNLKLIKSQQETIDILKSLVNNLESQIEEQGILIDKQNEFIKNQKELIDTFVYINQLSLKDIW